MDMNPKSDYPEMMIRGIKDEEWSTQEPPYLVAFFFDKKIRKDGRREMSIYWYDCEEALDMLRNQMNREGNPLFKGGYAIIRRNTIDEIRVRCRLRTQTLSP